MAVDDAGLDQHLDEVEHVDRLTEFLLEQLGHLGHTVAISKEFDQPGPRLRYDDEPPAGGITDDVLVVVLLPDQQVTDVRAAGGVQGDCSHRPTQPQVSHFSPVRGVTT